MIAFKVFFNELFCKSFDIFFIRNRKNCQKFNFFYNLFKNNLLTTALRHWINFFFFFFFLKIFLAQSVNDRQVDVDHRRMRGVFQLSKAVGDGDYGPRSWLLSNFDGRSQYAAKQVVTIKYQPSRIHCLLLQSCPKIKGLLTCYVVSIANSTFFGYINYCVRLLYISILGSIGYITYNPILI